MRERTSLAIFFGLLAAAAVFVWTTTAALPPVIASHFAGSGAANGFMTRATYLSLMLALVLGAPLLVALVPFSALGRQGQRLNIPHREHWLAPERREQSLAFLRRHSLRFAALVVVFLAYVHWLVVQANRIQPAQLSSAALLGGLAVFGAAMATWVIVLIRRFRKLG